jgi:hypothetical protein
MNGFVARQREFIACGPQRLRGACGALCLAAAITGPSAKATEGESPGLQISPADVVAAPAAGSGTAPPPPPTAQFRIPVIRPGVPSQPANAADAHEIRISPDDGTHRYPIAGPGRNALPIITPNAVHPRPAALGGPLLIVPQRSHLERSQHGAAEPQQPQPADPTEVPILPPPQKSDDVELPLPK